MQLLTIRNQIVQRMTDEPYVVYWWSSTWRQANKLVHHHLYSDRVLRRINAFARHTGGLTWEKRQ